MSRPLASIAYHEAGHAVVMLGFGFPLESVSIVPNGKSTGRVTPGEIPGLTAPAAPDTVEPEAPPITDVQGALFLIAQSMVTMAGPLAGRLAGFPEFEEDSEELLPGPVGDLLWQRLDLPPFRWHLTALGATERYLRVNWRAVDRVALTLLSEHILTGERARGLAAPLTRVDMQPVESSLTFWTRWAKRDTTSTAQDSATAG